MGAHLTGLERTRSGHFRIEQTFTLDQLRTVMAGGKGELVMTSIDEALSDFPLVRISEKETTGVLHGNQIPCPAVFANAASELVRLHSPDGRLLALARSIAGVLKPELVFS
jgi:tRNA U55 pseudouridine synthase TruB